MMRSFFGPFVLVLLGACGSSSSTNGGAPAGDGGAGGPDGARLDAGGAIADGPVSCTSIDFASIAPTTAIGSPLAMNVAYPIALALDDTHVYWADSKPDGTDGTVQSIAKTGGTPTMLASIDVNRASAVALDASNVYWTNLNNGKLARVAKTGGNVASFASPGSASDLALDATHAYALVSSSIVALPFDQDGGTSTTLASSLTAASRMSLHGSTLFFTVNGTPAMNEFLNGTVQSIGVDGSAQATIASNQVHPGPVVSNGREIAWLSYGKQAMKYVDGAVLLTSPDCTGTITLVSGVHYPLALAIDDAAIYFTTLQNGSANDGQLVRVGLHGGAAQILATGLHTPLSIAIDASAIYVGDADDFNAVVPGAIVTVPKP